MIFFLWSWKQRKFTFMHQSYLHAWSCSKPACVICILRSSTWLQTISVHRPLNKIFLILFRQSRRFACLFHHTRLSLCIFHHARISSCHFRQTRISPMPIPSHQTILMPFPSLQTLSLWALSIVADRPHVFSSSRYCSISSSFFFPLLRFAFFS